MNRKEHQKRLNGAKRQYSVPHNWQSASCGAFAAIHPAFIVLTLLILEATRRRVAKELSFLDTATLLFACRAKEVGQVVVAGQKKSVSAAAHPAATKKQQIQLHAIYPSLTATFDAIINGAPKYGHAVLKKKFLLKENQDEPK